MEEINELRNRIEKLEQKQLQLQEQVLKLLKRLNEKQPRRRPTIVGSLNSERIQLDKIKPSKPRPGDPQCNSKSG